MAMTAVTSVPRSADVKHPICFFPHRPSTLEGFPCTVVMPVSSTLYILPGSNVWASSSVDIPKYVNMRA